MLAELEEQLDNIKWNVFGLSEVKRTEEVITKLKSGHVMFYKGNNDTKTNGVGFPRSISTLVTKYVGISDWLAYITLKLSEELNFPIIQVEHTPVMYIFLR